MVHWFRICLAMQGTQVRSLVGQLSPPTTAAEPVRCSSDPSSVSKEAHFFKKLGFQQSSPSASPDSTAAPLLCILTPRPHHGWLCSHRDLAGPTVTSP